MKACWWRRAALIAACGTAALLAACGSGSIESRLNPSRVIVFGDGFSDLGNGGTRYTVNDASTNNWALRVAQNFGKTVSASASGGLGYAQGNARVALKPDAAGNAATRTVVEQIDAFLASGNPGADDLILMGGGAADIVVQAQALLAGSQTRAATDAAVEAAGQALAAQVRRLTDAGARQVAVVGPFNLGKSPWAIAIGQTALLEELTLKFNNAFLVAAVDLGNRALYIDAAYYFNLVVGNPASYSLANATDAVCNSVDAGAGIGTGAGQVNSALCTTATLVNASYDTYLFADRLHVTPAAHRLFGDFAFDRLRARW